MKSYRTLALLLAIVVGAASQPQSNSSIGGRVINALTGEPLKKVQITLHNTASDGSAAATTDDSGVFALPTLPAGTYELIIRKNGFVQTGQTMSLQSGQSATGTLIRLQPQAVIAGRVADRDGDPVSGVVVQAIRARSTGGGPRYAVMGTATTNDLGEYRLYGLNPGRYYLGGSYRGESGSAAVYFPDARDVSRAVPVDVSAAGETHGINLNLPGLSSIRIRGTIQGVDGTPVKGVTVVGVPCDAGPLNRSTASVQKSDGAFELRDLVPGCYLLAADVFNGGKRYSARRPVTLEGQNVEDLRMNLVPPVQVTGHVRIEGVADFAYRKVIVNLEAPLFRLTASGASNEDGTLLLNNVVPEVYGVNVVLPDGYYLKSAKYGQVDLMSSGLDLSTGAKESIELEIGADGGGVEGSVVDRDGRPMDSARVVLVSAGQTDGRFRQKTAVTDSKGAFSIRGIAPGDYKVYASRNLDVAAFQDSSFVKQVEPEAKSVSIHERGIETLSLQAMLANSLPF